MKEYLYRHGVNFEEKDITVDEKAMEEVCQKTDLMAVPTLVIDGEVMVGFDKNHLDKFFNS